MMALQQLETAKGPQRHVSVMRDEAVAALAPVDGGTYIDGTFGAGGYSRAILDIADTKVVGIDRDRTAVSAGFAMVEEAKGRLTLVEGRFGDLKDIVQDLGIERVEGVVLDVGVWSLQLDTAEPGFCLRFDGPLDKRMGPKGPHAAGRGN
jgi:16S rRNA (cytosine1402-N4)-methyltransferase